MFLVLSNGNVTNLQPLVCSTQFGDGLGLCQGGSLRDQDLQDQSIVHRNPIILYSYLVPTGILVRV
jgi:hypothetical protein